jgi:predicted kinase
MVDALFLAGHDIVILDATNTTESRRAEWDSIHYKRSYAIFKTSEEECLKRALDNKQDYLVPVINKMARQIKFPESNITVIFHNDYL